MVRPDLFIPAAEDAGLMERVTARVIELAARDAAKLFARFPDFALSVNLSAADLHSTHTVALLQRLIRESHAGPTNLIIEVTERGLLEPDAAKNSIRALRANAIRVAIDDFGTGFSSLSYLGTFELDFLKIDKAFVDALGTEAPTSRVALTIIEMGKALNLELIAEGIETAAQAEFLRDHGVHYGRGGCSTSPCHLSTWPTNCPTARARDRTDSSTRSTSAAPLSTGGYPCCSGSTRAGWIRRGSSRNSAASRRCCRRQYPNRPAMVSISRLRVRSRPRRAADS